MTAMESQFVDTATYDPAYATPAYLKRMEPSMTYVPVSPDGPFRVTARAKDDTLDYRGEKAGYTMGTTSESGRVFYVVADKSRGEVRYFWVDKDGTTREGTGPGAE